MTALHRDKVLSPIVDPVNVLTGINAEVHNNNILDGKSLHSEFRTKLFIESLNNLVMEIVNCIVS